MRTLGAMLLLLAGLGCGEEETHLALGGQCELSSECAAPLVCRLERCRKECVTHRDCDIKTWCVLDNDGLGACTLPEESRCDTSDECPSPLVCRFERCVNECVEDIDCPPGGLCRDEACVDPAESVCTSDAECAGDLVCARDGRCRDQCRTDRDCRGGTECEEGSCVRVEPTADGGMDAGGADAATLDAGVSDAATDGGTGTEDAGWDAAVDDAGPLPPWVLLKVETLKAGVLAAPPGRTGIPIGGIRFVNGPLIDVTVTGVDIHVTAPTAVGTARLWLDVNRNAALDDPDRMLDEIASPATSPLGFRFSETLGPETEAAMILEIDVATTATDGTVDFELASPADVLSTAPRVHTTDPPPAVGSVRVQSPAGTLAAAVGPATPTAGAVSPSVIDAPALHLELGNRTGWVRSRTLTSQTSAVHFPVDATTGWAVGRGGAVWRTTDGGGSWTSVPVGEAVDLNDVWFLDASEGWVAGNGGRIFHTVDGGNSWTPVPYATTANLHGIQFLDSLNGWAVGDGLLVLHTTDGGSNWSPVTTGATGTGAFRGLFFLDASTGWIVGDGGRILRTINGGTSFDPLASGVTSRLNDVFFADAAEGWVVGASSVIRHTVNAGDTWTAQTACAGFLTLNAVQIPDGIHGFAIGNGICGTSDGGATWTLQGYLNAVDGSCPSADASTCWAATALGPARTDDGGAGVDDMATGLWVTIGGTVPLSAYAHVTVSPSNAAGGVVTGPPPAIVPRPGGDRLFFPIQPIPAGTTVYYLVSFGLNGSATAGDVILSVEADADLLHVAGTVTGTFPLTGATQTVTF